MHYLFKLNCILALAQIKRHTYRALGMLEFSPEISSACIHNNAGHHTELFEKSSKIKEGNTHSKPARQILENLCHQHFVKKGERNLLRRKVPVSKLHVYFFANPFST